MAALQNIEMTVSCDSIVRKFSFYLSAYKMFKCFIILKPFLHTMKPESAAAIQEASDLGMFNTMDPIIIKQLITRKNNSAIKL